MAQTNLHKPNLNALAVTSPYSRLGAVSFVLAALMFVIYPAVRPFSDEASLQGAAAFGSTAWMISHVTAIFAFLLLLLGLFSLYETLRGTVAERLAASSLLLSSLGIGLTLPFYGAELFGLHAIGQAAVKQQNASLLDLASDIRFGTGFFMILIGLLLLGIGTIIAATAIWKSQTLAKWSGLPFALGFLLYLPQYMATQPLRVAHGLLIAISCAWIGWSMLKKDSAKSQH